MNKTYTIKESSNLTRIEEYQLTVNPDITAFKEADGTIIDLGAWCIYETETNGEPVTVLAIQDKNTGECYSGMSAYFIESFKQIMAIMDAGDIADHIYIKIVAGKSKKGRKFTNCALSNENAYMNQGAENPFAE